MINTLTSEILAITWLIIYILFLISTLQPKKEK
jgi:hypothetical protein